MKIATFDLFGNERKENHGIKIYHDISFGAKNIKFNDIETKTLGISNLTKVLNKIDYRACHNYYGYDGDRLPLLNESYKNNIDTLLIDCLISFDSSKHNLNKSINNNPIEDAKTTFNILEKNIIVFNGFSSELKNIIYSLLNDNDKYNVFFEFYIKLTNDKLFLLNRNEIINNYKRLLKQESLENNSIVLYIIKILEKNTLNTKLTLTYIALFINKKKIVLPKFIIKNEKHENFNYEFVLILSKFNKLITKNLNKNIYTYLEEFYGFKSFTGRTQKDGVKATLENSDFLTILSTGGGKSLIYQLPARIVGSKLGHLTLIITPLKALIKDQIDGLKSKGFNEVNYFSGDQSIIEKDIIYNRIISGKTKILFLTPESLRNENLLSILQNRYISRVVVDEAHTLILWGQEFRPDYFFIKHFISDLEKSNLNNNINITLLTATATLDVKIGIIDYFDNRNNIKIIKSDDVLKKNIHPQIINITDKSNKIELLINKIKEIDVNNNPTIIFANKRDTTEEIVKQLAENNIDSKHFHSKIFYNEKKQIQDDFIKGKLNLIVATKAFGMGIDKKGVKYVIHYDLPGNIEDYTQEIGRAGRGQKNGEKDSINIIFYDKKVIEKSLGQIRGINYKHIQNFLNNKYIDYKKKTLLSPRSIAIKCGIKTDEENWETEVTKLLSFLEQEKFKGKTILTRRYNRTSIFFNKIENKVIEDNNNRINNNQSLNIEEKKLAKLFIKRVIVEKKALDLNKIEENFYDYNDQINFEKIKYIKVIDAIRDLEILSKGENEEDSIVIIERGFLYDDNDIFKKYKYKLDGIERIKDGENETSLNSKLKNYYSFKNYININNGHVRINNKTKLYKHFNDLSNEGKIILEYIFKDQKNKDKIEINLKNLLYDIQKNYSKNYTIIMLKEALFFLDRLNIIKLKNGLLVFLTKYTLIFNEGIINNQEQFKEYFGSEEFGETLKEKLIIYTETKINKLLALKSIIEILEERGEKEYSNLTLMYFKINLNKFADEHFTKEENKK